MGFPSASTATVFFDRITTDDIFWTPAGDVVPMRIVECGGDGGRNAHRLVHRELLLAFEAVAKRLAFHVRHYEVEEPVRLAAVEQRKDVGMLKVGRDADLAQEALGAQHRADAAPEFPFQHVPVGECDSELIRDGRA